MTTVASTDFPTTLEVKNGTYQEIGEVVDVSELKMSEGAMQAYADSDGGVRFVPEGVTRIAPITVTLNLTGLMASGSGVGCVPGTHYYYKFHSPYAERYFYGQCTDFSINGANRLAPKVAQGTIVIQPEGLITNTDS